MKFKFLTKNGCFDLEMTIRFISVDLQTNNRDTTMLGSCQAVHLLIKLYLIINYQLFINLIIRLFNYHKQF